ncbi:hypothetical protein GCM10027276_26070 [Comamonas piscis]
MAVEATKGVAAIKAAVASMRIFFIKLSLFKTVAEGILAKAQEPRSPGLEW